MYYATVKYKEEFGFVNDVLRFSTKEEHDSFVAERDYAESITKKDAQAQYKEQFFYWGQETKRNSK